MATDGNTAGNTEIGKETDDEFKTRVRWVYNLSKISLVPLLFGSELPYSETLNLDALRKVYIFFLRNGQDATLKNYSAYPLAKPEKLPAELAKLAKASKGEDLVDHTKILTKKQDDKDHLAELRSVQKQGIKFSASAKDSSVDFLERLEELQEQYSIGDTDLLRALPHLLEGPALLWYRNFHNNWKTWADFEKAFHHTFFPLHYFEKLEEEAKNRKQKPNEKILDYHLAISTCFRRHGSFSNTDMTRIFYKNLRPEYNYFLKDDYTSLSISRMVELEKKYESIKEDEKETKPTTRILEPKETDRLWKPPATQRMCWLCKKAGHLMNECPSSLTKTKTAIQAGPSCELKFNEEAEELSGSEVGPVEVIGELTTAKESSMISDRRPYVPLILNNLKVSALVDTGAKT